MDVTCWTSPVRNYANPQAPDISRLYSAWNSKSLVKMLQAQEEGNLYLLSCPDSYPLNPHLHRGWSHVVAPGAMNSPDSMLLARTHQHPQTVPEGVCGRGRNRQNERKTNGGWRKFLLLLCHVGSLAPHPCALLRISHVAGLFALVTESATISLISPRFIRGFALYEILLKDLDWGNLPRHRLSCTYLARILRQGYFGQTSCFHNTLVDLLI